MKFHKQRFRHRPEQGEFGDCCRTVYACLLDLEPEDVPNFGVHYNDTPAFVAAEMAWLNSQGLTKFSSGYTGDLDQVLLCTTAINSQAWLMLTGTSRTGCNHVVIVRNGAIVHDPSLDESGIVGPASDGYYWIEALVPYPDHQRTPQ